MPPVLAKSAVKLLTVFAVLCVVGCSMFDRTPEVSPDAIYKDPGKYMNRVIRLRCVAGHPLEMPMDFYLVPCLDHEGFGWSKSSRAISVASDDELHEGQNVSLKGVFFIQQSANNQQSGNYFFCPLDSKCMLIFHPSVTADVDTSAQSAKAAGSGDGKTTAEFDAGMRPIEEGRRYTGTQCEDSRCVPLTMLTSGASSSSVNVDFVSLGGKKDRWTGSFNPGTGKLELTAPPSDSVSLKYSPGGNWNGEMKLVKGRSNTGERIFASIQIRLGAGTLAAK